MIILVVSLAIIAGAFAFRERRRADQLQKRCISLGTELACRGARIGDLVAHNNGQAAELEVLRETCAAQHQRINNLLDLARVHEARIAEQAGMIELARRMQVPVNGDLIFEN